MLDRIRAVAQQAFEARAVAVGCVAFGYGRECFIEVVEDFFRVAFAINSRYGEDVFDIWFFRELHHDF